MGSLWPSLLDRRPPSLTLAHRIDTFRATTYSLAIPSFRISWPVFLRLCIFLSISWLGFAERESSGWCDSHFVGWNWWTNRCTQLRQRPFLVVGSLLPIGTEFSATRFILLYVCWDDEHDKKVLRLVINKVMGFFPGECCFHVSCTLTGLVVRDGHRLTGFEFFSTQTDEHLGLNPLSQLIFVCSGFNHIFTELWPAWCSVLYQVAKSKWIDVIYKTVLASSIYSRFVSR